MSWVARTIAVTALGLGGVSLTGGTIAGLLPVDLPANSLSGAELATKVPAFPDATFRQVTTGDYFEGLGESLALTRRSWFFETSTPLNAVADFYRENLPAGSEVGVGGDGTVVFEWAPTGAAEGESVLVIVRPGELQVSETVRANSGA